jgi:hypothetical protein
MPVSTPNESLLFARAITGDPSRGAVTNDAGAEVDCEYLEWLAAISPEYERRLRNLAKTPHSDEPRQEQLEWLAAISPEYARQLRDLQREEAIAAEVRERSRQIIERLELAAEQWDDSKHPRAGGPPNAGWFVSTGSSGALARLPANPSPKPDGLARPPRQQDQLAQAQQPGQPPAQGGQQLPAPGNDRHTNPFGTWPKRPAGFVPQRIRDYGAGWFRTGQVTRAYDGLPQPVQNMLRNNRVEVSIDKDDTGLRVNNPEMKADAVGGYDSSTGIIHIFDTRKIPGGAVAKNVGLSDTLRHEVGHAADHYLSDISQTPEFMQAFQADINAVPNQAALSKQDKHLLSKPREAFAEAFARTLERRKNPGVLPNSMKYMQQSRAVQQLLGS